MVLVEVLVERAGGIEETADVAVAGFRAEPGGCNQVVSVPAVFPAAVFGDGLDDLDSGVPAFLGCLWEIAVSQFPSGLRQEMLAGLLKLLGSYLSLLLLR